jgi:uncharacterized membrane protein
MERLMSIDLPFLVIAAIVGSGLVSGLLFAFSVVIMRALMQFAPEIGMQAMQRINIVIINPMFLLAFLGTSVLCLAIAVIALLGASHVGSRWLLAGAVAYLLGPLGITMLFNVPLNNRLADTPANHAETEWPRYASAWLRWNHARTALGALAMVFLCIGLAKSVN